MRIKMHLGRAAFLTLAAAAVLCMAGGRKAKAFGTDTQVLPADTLTAAEGCVFVGVYGDYITEAQKALDRINEIRLEACREHVKNPADSAGNVLTEADYVPIKWSSALEASARLRAAEASISISHTRPNGNGCFSLKAEGVFESGEVLAWNFSKSMLPGIEQWYEEKSIWVNGQDGVTGHYTSMINPKNTYVGLGCFYNSNARFRNTTCGRFSSTPNQLESSMQAVTGCIQMIEVKESVLSAPVFMFAPLSDKETSQFKKGEKAELSIWRKCVIDGNSSYVLLTSDAVWSSSSDSVLSVAGKGFYAELSFLGEGKATVTAQSGGQTVSQEITVLKGDGNTGTSGGGKEDGNTGTSDGNKGNGSTGTSDGNKGNGNTGTSDGSKGNGNTGTSGGNKGNGNTSTSDGGKGDGNTGTSDGSDESGGIAGADDDSSTVPLIGKASVSAGKKKLTVKCNKISGADGIQIQYSTNKKWKKNGKKLNKASTKKKQTVKLKGLKSGKKYYVRIRAYRLVNGEKVYGDWTPAMACRTK